MILRTKRIILYMSMILFLLDGLTININDL